MNLWKNYTSIIKKNCANPINTTLNLSYWRNQLFAGTIIYILLFCTIALVPGIYYSFFTNNISLVVIDIISFLSVLIIAFAPKISIPIRKLIFIITIYFLAITLIYKIGLYGPGLLFMQTAGILCILIFPGRYSYYSAVFNTLICVIFSFLIGTGFLPWSETLQNSLGAWIAVTSNLIFLSFLLSALIPRLFNGLQQTLLKEKQISIELQEKQDSLKKAIQQLEHKNSEIEQFAYIASHDLQEPLRMVTSFMTLLQKKYESIFDEKAKSYTYYAIDGAQRMKIIILELLEYSKIGKTDDQLETIDINEVINETKILFRQQINLKNTLIETGVFPLIKSYKTPIKQVLQNLIGNAIKYSAKNKASRINIELSEENQFWKFKISDNGIGIDAQYFDDIFIIFKRLHNSSEYEGTGMGLAICKKIVENLGGKIWVESKKNVGSIFYFTLPKTNNLE